VTVADVDAVACAARASADAFLQRDCERIALHAGLHVHAVRQLRDNRDDLLPSVAKVALVAYGGRMIGRTFEQTAAFLAPVFDASGCDAAPRLPIVGSIGINAAIAETARECGEAVAKAVASSGKPNSADETCRECDQAIFALERLKEEARAASVTPIRGSKFAK
jgi:hypothetical protein